MDQQRASGIKDACPQENEGKPNCQEAQENRESNTAKGVFDWIIA
jgi:hypothetical protein